MSVTGARPFTYEDYLLLPEDRRYEIIGGELYMTESPTTYHQRILLKLTRFVDDHVLRGQLGEVFVAPYDVVLSETDVVQPDLLFVSTERASIIGEKNITGPPDLVVEVLSPGTAQRDQTLKSKTYERFGVRELWIASPEARTIEVLVNTEKSFRREAIYGFGDRLRSSLLPGLEISLDKVF